MTNSTKFLLTLIAVGAALWVNNLHAVEATGADRVEYLTLRWAGRENTHLIRPNGEVEFIGKQLMSTKRPERADDRSFYMNVTLNALAKDGYELIAMTSDDYILRRRVGR